MQCPDTNGVAVVGRARALGFSVMRLNCYSSTWLHVEVLEWRSPGCVHGFDNAAS